MGSPWGPTLPDFYMSLIKGAVLNQKNVSKPNFYMRYGDEIFYLLVEQRHVNFFRHHHRPHNHSVLKITVEDMLSTIFNLLNVNLMNKLLINKLSIRKKAV